MNLNIKFIARLEKIRSSYWFIPTVMVVGAIVLAVAAVEIDQARQTSWPGFFGWIASGSPEEARSFLATVAGSMITIASVTFSITMVALVQASGQFGPRLLVNFMRDRGNQIVLGTFIATFIYCLMVLRSVRSTEHNIFVPHFALLIAFGLSISSVGVLVYFLHHIAIMLQAEHVIGAVGRELERAVARLYPDELTFSEFRHELEQPGDLPDYLDMDEASTVTATRNGYVQAIDADGLLALAEENDWVLRLMHRPGDFIANGSVIVAVWPDADLQEDVTQQIEEAFVLGQQRLRIQDVEFPVNQLVEIAVRALSPGINDPFTAIACVDQLTSGLSQLVERSIPAGYRYGEDGKLRLLTDALTFTSIIAAAFDQVRQHARADVAVTMRLLEAIATIAPHTRTREQREVLTRQAEMLRRGSENAIPEELDRQDIERRYQQAVEALTQHADQSTKTA